MGSMGRMLVVLAAIAVFGVSCLRAQTPAATTPEAALRECPSDDFVLRRSLPASARPMVRLDSKTLAQPRGGKIRFIITDWPGAVFQNSFTVCFRWRSSGDLNSEIMPSPIPVRIESVNGRETAILATVPDLPSTHTRLWAVLASLGLVGDPEIAHDARGHTLSNRKRWPPTTLSGWREPVRIVPRGRVEGFLRFRDGQA